MRDEKMHCPTCFHPDSEKLKGEVCCCWHSEEAQQESKRYEFVNISDDP